MQASDHRAIARSALKGNWGVAILVSFVAGLIGGTSGSFNIDIDLETMETLSASLPSEISSLVMGVLAAVMMVMGMVATVLSIVHFVLGGVIWLGEAKYNLNLIDRKEAAWRDLFSQFDRLGPALVMNLLRGIFIALWSLLFVIPGIVASYSYAMAPYIMLEDPNCSGSEALKRSKAMMNGHKGELFWLDMTFIGWTLLNILTLGIGSLWLNPYIKASYASFYRDLQNQGYVTVE